MFDLNAPDMPEKPNLQIELWSSGLLKSTLEGSVKVSLTMIKALVGELEVQREQRFWFPSRNSEERPFSIRVGLDIGRSDSTILRHLQEGIARLLQAEKGDEVQTGLGLRVLSLFGCSLSFLFRALASC